jgi:hypothetical protein
MLLYNDSDAATSLMISSSGTVPQTVGEWTHAITPTTIEMVIAWVGIGKAKCDLIGIQLMNHCEIITKLMHV